MSERPPAPDPRHGGELALARARYGEPEGGWLDLSTGINPDPWPVPPGDAEGLRRLPEPDALARLMATAGAAYRAPPSVGIAAVPGSDLAIRLLPLVPPAGPVTIVGPTYRSHEEAWAAAGQPVTVSSVLPATGGSGVLVVTNPNNPDGRAWPAAKLAELAAAMARSGGMLVVDEAFADIAPERSLVPLLSGLPAIVLRSFGKFFGLAGLRLGFVLGPLPVIQRVSRLLGDWPVSAPAIAIGTAALADIGWQATARRRIRARADAVRAMIEAHRLTISGDGGLFLLIEHPDAAGLHDRLAQQGVWTRIFGGRPSWLRIGLPPEAALPRLDAALASALG